MAAAANTMVQTTLDFSAVQKYPLESAHDKAMGWAMKQWAARKIDLLTNRNLSMRHGGTAEVPRKASKSDFSERSVQRSAHNSIARRSRERRTNIGECLSHPSFLFFKSIQGTSFRAIPKLTVNNGSNSCTGRIKSLAVSSSKSQHDVSYTAQTNLTEICFHVVVRMAEARNERCIELDVYDPTRAPQQKRGEQQKRDDSRRTKDQNNMSAHARKTAYEGLDKEIVLRMLHPVPTHSNGRFRKQKTEVQVLKSTHDRKCNEMHAQDTGL